MTNFHNIYTSVISECATGFGGEECDLTNDTLAELLKRLMDAERDAGRYRWIRNKEENPCGLTREQFDEKIDAAINEDVKCNQK